VKKKSNIYNILLIGFAIVFAVSSFFLVKELIQRRQASEYLAQVQSQYIPEIPAFLNTNTKDNNSTDNNTKDNNATNNRAGNYHRSLNY